MAKLYALHDPDLKPVTVQVPGMGDDGLLLSLDTCILLARDGVTPKAKRVYRLYLKHRRALERSGFSGQAMRTEAFYRAMEEMGANIVQQKIAGLTVGRLQKDV